MNNQDLTKLLKTSDNVETAIKELQNGRGKAIPNVDNINKEADHTQHKVMQWSERPDKIIKVDKEDNSMDPNLIAMESSSAQYNTKIEKVCRLPLAIQSLIVKRAVAFCFGSPVVINADPADGTKEADVLKAINAVLFDAKTKTVNRVVARNTFTYTECAELWYVEEGETNHYGFKSGSKLKCQVLAPSKDAILFPYFDDYGNMIAFSRSYAMKRDDSTTIRYFETWTNEAHYLWKVQEGSWTNEEGYPRRNEIGKIPVIYARQEKPEWHDVQELIERLEKLLSNFGDTNDYHAAPKIIAKGGIQGWAKKGDSGSVIEIDNDANIEYLTWSQAPEAVKLEIEQLIRHIYTISQTPDISFETMKGLGQLSGTALRTLFMDAHLKVMEKAEIFDEYLQRRISVIKAFLKKMNPDQRFVEACDTLIVEPEIVPYMIEDEQSKINMLMAANGNRAIASREATIQLLGWTNDVKAEMERIQAEDTAAMSGMMGLNVTESGM